MTREQLVLLETNQDDSNFFTNSNRVVGGEKYK
jgi:hypothetical protein